MPEQRDPRPMGRGQSDDSVTMNEYISLLRSLRERGADLPDFQSPEDVIAFAREKGLLESRE
jgi:hypothetical protein